MQQHLWQARKQIHPFPPSLLYPGKSLILCQVKWAILMESYKPVIVGVRVGIHDRVSKVKSLQAGIRTYKWII